MRSIIGTKKSPDPDKIILRDFADGKRNKAKTRLEMKFLLKEKKKKRVDYTATDWSIMWIPSKIRLN